jgi:hypothetical protein
MFATITIVAFLTKLCFEFIAPGQGMPNNPAPNNYVDAKIEETAGRAPTEVIAPLPRFEPLETYETYDRLVGTWHVINVSGAKSQWPFGGAESMEFAREAKVGEVSIPDAVMLRTKASAGEAIEQIPLGYTFFSRTSPQQFDFIIPAFVADRRLISNDRRIFRATYVIDGEVLRIYITTCPKARPPGVNIKGDANQVILVLRRGQRK